MRKNFIEFTGRWGGCRVLVETGSISFVQELDRRNGGGCRIHFKYESGNISVKESYGDIFSALNAAVYGDKNA